MKNLFRSTTFVSVILCLFLLTESNAMEVNDTEDDEREQVSRQFDTWIRCANLAQCKALLETAKQKKGLVLEKVLMAQTPDGSNRMLFVALDQLMLTRFLNNNHSKQEIIKTLINFACSQKGLFKKVSTMQDSKGQTLLFILVRFYGCSEVIGSFLEAAQDEEFLNDVISHEDQQGYTALHKAVSGDGLNQFDLKIIQLLISFGVDVDAKITGGPDCEKKAVEIRRSKDEREEIQRVIDPLMSENVRATLDALLGTVDPDVEMPEVLKPLIISFVTLHQTM